MADRAGSVSLSDFFGNQPLPPPPDNLGNVPPDEGAPPESSPGSPAPPPLRAERPEPEEPEPEQPLPQDEEEETPGEAAPAGEQRVRDLEDRLNAQARELAFLRAGQPPSAPQPSAQPAGPQDVLAPIRAMFGGYQVTPEDVQVIIQDPARGAEYLTRGMYAAAAAGAAYAAQQLRGEFWQFQNSQQHATQLRDYFYGQHPDLVPYAEMVGTKAQQVQAQYPNADATTLVAETARRTREQLKSWGINPKTQPRNLQAVPGRPQPVRAEMSSRRAGGARAVSPQQRDLDTFLAATNRR